ncbi:MAG TPA: 5-(carboxyamino)imidazole ribonucleotide synthase [Ilumatobacteraceae bacterium]|nr:5-(carboxyamino)imidazole ribonucleotide synthase [Ilumatobacteraceae bacterium]
MSLQPITPPATIGVLGGGQLGRYAVMAATAMGYRTMVLDPDPSAPAGMVANDHLVAQYDDPVALQRLMFECDVVTTEFENPPSYALDQLAGGVVVAPPPEAVAIAQDRIAEKSFLLENGFSVGPFATLVDDRQHVDDALVVDGAIVKTARLGYDGKGQRSVRGVAETFTAWAELGGVPCVVEQRLDLEIELSVLVARTADGRVEAWPVAENHHVDGILDLTVVPADVPTKLADRAVGLGMAIADALGYVGVLAVELFVVGGELLVNELAPRPHNSGHWTLDACVTSQYEQQVRAVCGLGLGSTAMTARSVAMVNLLGDLWETGEPDWSIVFDDPHAKLHLYGKSHARPGRKMGHLTVTSDVATAAVTRALELRSAAVRSPPPRPLPFA